ncbi:MAG: bifunctional 3,4-dihydroxy-2-butanone 4-phosphate synthase/GTP cyclohydrolase II [Epsilonproteobacteria bacterium]|nr:bifunctional 3,4-dihydroxy-2-butanone 4-phosphate synthase/GTP cyclohydrolase II [Campylobacterota bacterium]
MSEAIKRVLNAIEDIKKGKMVVMVDDEDRENEGDLVYAATFSTPQMVNFMAKEARGLICTPMTKEIAKRLELEPMVKNNDSAHETAFTISVDLATAKTGISAIERDACIKALASPLSTPKDFVRPGHIFPLIAKDGGVLVRTGHTEGSVDLCTLAGLSPVAVICEIIKDDGTMARRDDLDIFRKKHNLNIVYISDIVEYRLANEKLIKEISKEIIEFFDVKVEKINFRDHLNRVHSVIKFYGVHSRANVKFHNISTDLDLLTNSHKYNTLMEAIEYLKKNSGLLVFLDTKTISKEQAKEYGIGAQILKHLGVKEINLLTTNKDTEFIGISGFGLNIAKKIVL